MRSLLKGPNNTRKKITEELDRYVSPLVRAFINNDINFSKGSQRISAENFQTLFCDWLIDSRTLKEIYKNWCKDKEGPWSLSLTLSRYLLRFQESALEVKNYSEFSQSGQFAWLDLPNPVRELTKPIMSAFSAMTSNLPKEIRLCYQLYLEGVLINEIAWITQIEENCVRENIQRAKENLGCGIERETGT